MQRRGHMLRLTAVSVLVVMALTGFKARGHGSSHGHGSGHGSGGGCSSSSQDHDSSSSTSGGGYGSGTRHDYDDDDDYSGGTGGSGSSGVTGRDGQVKLVGCATVKAPYATVEVTNPNTTYHTFTVHVSFYDAKGKVLAEREQEVGVSSRYTTTAQVPVDDARAVRLVDHCEVEPYAP